MPFNAGEVQSRLTLDRSAFTRELQAAEADADKFSAKDITPKIDLTGVEDIRKQITSLSRSLTTLGKKNVAPKVNLDGVKGTDVELAKINAQLDRMKAVTVRPKIDPSGFTKANTQIALTQARLDKLNKSSGGGIPTWVKLGGAITAAVSAATPIAGAATLGILGFGTAAVSAGVGVAGLAAVVKTQVSKINDALTALGKGDTGPFDALTGQEKRAAVALDQLKKQWTATATGLEPVTLPIVTTGLDEANRLLPKFVPVIKAAAGGVKEFQTDLDTALNGPGFQQWLDTIGHEAPGLIKAGGNAIIGLGSAFGTVTEKLAPFVPAIDNAIGAIGSGAENLVSGSGFDTFLDHLAADVPPTIRFIETLGKSVGSIIADLEPIGIDLLNIGSNALPTVTAGFHALSTVIEPVTKFLSDNEEVVTALAAAYGGYKLVKGVDNFAGSLSKMIGTTSRLGPAGILTAGVVAGISAGFASHRKDVDQYNASLNSLATKGLKGLDDFNPAKFGQFTNQLQTNSKAVQTAGLFYGAFGGDVDKVTGKLNDQKLQLSYAETGYTKLGSATGKSATQLFQYAQKIPGLTDQIKHLGQLQQRMALQQSLGLDTSATSKGIADTTKQIKGEIQAVQQASNPTYQMSQALKQLDSSAPVDKIKALDDALTAYRDTVSGMLGSNAALGDSIANTFQSIKGVDINAVLTDKVVGANQATRDFANSVAGLGGQLDQNLTEYAKQGHSVNQVAARYQDLRKQFIGAATDAGLTRKQANQLVNQYLSIPKDIRTKISAPGATTAKKQADDVKGSVKQIPGQKSVVVSTNGHAAAGELNSVTSAAGHIPPRKIVTASADTQTARNNLETLATYTRTLPDAHITAVADTGAAEGQLETLTRPRSVSIEVIPHTSNVAQGQLAGHATGGTVRGIGTGTSDSNIVALSTGEEVINARQAKKHRPLLKAINAGIRGFATGGTIGIPGYATGGTVNTLNIGRDILASIARALSGTASLDRIGQSITYITQQVSVLGKVGDTAASTIKTDNGKLQTLARQRQTIYANMAKQQAILSDPNATKSRKVTAASSLAEDNKKLATNAAQRNKLMTQIASEQAIKRYADAKDTQLTKLIRNENNQLTSLAKQRDSVAKQLTDVKAFRSNIQTSVTASNSLTGLGTTYGVKNVEAEWRSKLQAIKSFTANIKTLAKRGLARQMLNELITQFQTDPESAADLAQQLVSGSKGDIGDLNSIQYQINTSATALAKLGTQINYGKSLSGDFVSSLLGQENKIKSMMERVADAFAKRVSQITGAPQRRATGGPIIGPGTSTSDSVLVAASDGEFMQQAAAVRREGVAKMAALNEGRATITPLDGITPIARHYGPQPGYATGGQIVTPSRGPQTVTIDAGSLLDMKRLIKAGVTDGISTARWAISSDQLGKLVLASQKATRGRGIR